MQRTAWAAPVHVADRVNARGGRQFHELFELLIGSICARTHELQCLAGILCLCVEISPLANA